jgi:hypothetical protein
VARIERRVIFEVRNHFREALARGEGLLANADTHFLSGFSLFDTEPFSFSNFANCSRT